MSQLLQTLMNTLLPGADLLVTSGLQTSEQEIVSVLADQLTCIMDLPKDVDVDMDINSHNACSV